MAVAFKSKDVNDVNQQATYCMLYQLKKNSLALTNSEISFTALHYLCGDLGYSFSQDQYHSNLSSKALSLVLESTGIGIYLHLFSCSQHIYHSSTQDFMPSRLS